MILTSDMLFNQGIQNTNKIIQKEKSVILLNVYYTLCSIYCFNYLFNVIYFKSKYFLLNNLIIFFSYYAIKKIDFFYKFAIKYK